MSPTKKKILFSLCTLIIVLICGEILARVFLEQEIPLGTPLDEHSELGWQLPEDERDQYGHPVRRDEKGLRKTTENDSYSHLIYTTGDSSIFGHGLQDQETLHAHIEQECKKNGLSVKGITGAVPGYSSVQSLNQLYQTGWDQNPNLLIIGNLWSDNDIMKETQLLDEQQDPIEEESWLMRNSALWRWMSIQILVDANPFRIIGWMDDVNYESGFRRVAPTRYGAILDRMIREAGARNISVVLLSPCNRPLAAKEEIENGYPWDVYFEIMNDVAKYRSVPIVSGCAVAHKNSLLGDEAFIDRMHPTSRLNQAYAKEIVYTLQQLKWPNRSILPNLNVEAYSRTWNDPLPSVYPEPTGKENILRPDNVIHDDSVKHRAGPRPQ